VIDVRVSLDVVHHLHSRLAGGLQQVARPIELTAMHGADAVSTVTDQFPGAPNGEIARITARFQFGTNVIYDRVQVVQVRTFLLSEAHAVPLGPADTPHILPEKQLSVNRCQCG
jgi:hypothetical protein